MRTFLQLALVLAVPAGWLAAAEPAQRIIPEGTTVQLILLRQKSVQQELKLTDEDAKKIGEFTSKQHDAFKDLPKLGENEQKQKLAAMEKENKQFLADTLSAAQRKRLEQITMQLTGLMQLARPEVAKALDLTDEQQQKVKQFQKESRPALEEVIHAKNREARSEKLAKLRADNRRKIMGLLTDEQKAKVMELVGARFEGAIVFEEPE